MVCTELELTDLMLQLDANLSTQAPLLEVIADRKAKYEYEVRDFTNVVRELKANEAALREDIKQSVAALGGSPYRCKATGRTASLVMTMRTAVQDTERVRGFLAERGDLDAFLILDEKAVLDLAKTVAVPGVENVSSTTLRVK